MKIGFLRILIPVLVATHGCVVRGRAVHAQGALVRESLRVVVAEQARGPVPGSFHAFAGVDDGFRRRDLATEIRRIQRPLKDRFVDLAQLGQGEFLPEEGMRDA